MPVNLKQSSTASYCLQVIILKQVEGTLQAAREEMSRLMTIQNQQGPRNDQRYKGHDFVSSTLAYLDQMFPQLSETNMPSLGVGTG